MGRQVWFPLQRSKRERLSTRERSDVMTNLMSFPAHAPPFRRATAISPTTLFVAAMGMLAAACARPSTPAPAGERAPSAITPYNGVSRLFDVVPADANGGDRVIGVIRLGPSSILSLQSADPDRTELLQRLISEMNARATLTTPGPCPPGAAPRANCSRVVARGAAELDVLVVESFGRSHGFELRAKADAADSHQR